MSGALVFAGGVCWSPCWVGEQGALLRVGLWCRLCGVWLLAWKIGCPGGSGVGVLPVRPCTPGEDLLWDWNLYVGIGIGSSGFVVGLLYRVNFPEVKMWQAERAKKSTCDQCPAMFCCIKEIVETAWKTAALLYWERNAITDCDECLCCHWL